MSDHFQDLKLDEVMIVLNVLQLWGEELEGVEEGRTQLMRLILESPDLFPQCVRVSTEECH